MNIEFLRTRFSWGKEVLFLLVLFLLINILILDIKLFADEEKEAISPTPSETQPEVTPPVVQPVENDACPSACLEAIAESITTGSTPTTTPPVVTTTEPAVKEFYIPLGSGSTSSSTWVELPGIESVIDMENYPNVKEIIFEATMRIVTGNGRVYAKLYNVSDKHDAWYSEVYAEGSGGYRAESGNIILAPGRKVYRVMMKSTMGTEAILDNARIKILLN